MEGSLIVQEVKKRKGNEGYNVATGEYEDLVKAGVVDPKKVTRSALQNAASIAGLLLTTEASSPRSRRRKRRPRCLRAAEWAEWTTSPDASGLATAQPAHSSSTKSSRPEETRGGFFVPISSDGKRKAHCVRMGIADGTASGFGTPRNADGIASTRAAIIGSRQSLSHRKADRIDKKIGSAGCLGDRPPEGFSFKFPRNC